MQYERQGPHFYVYYYLGFFHQLLTNNISRTYHRVLIYC
jgi:hypothetical protein